MSEQPNVKNLIAPTEAAEYIAELSSDLAQIARRHRLDALGFILDMARLEAETVTRLQPGTRPDYSS